MKFRKMFMLFAFVAILYGCAGLKQAVNETTPEQVAATQAQVSSVVTPVTGPYGIPIALLLGYMGAVVKNWWKDKHPKETTTV